MGIIPDAVINLVLMVAFGIYCVMGLSFFIMGIVYMGDAGAIGSTGVYLIFLGLLMLIIGGIALWANMNSNWMVLFIIELINVALFLFLYILIVIVLMMATGTTDPVREATVETWNDVLPGLTLPGSNPDGDGSAASGTYCETQTEGTACADYYAASDAAPFQTNKCVMTEPITQMQGLNNCSMFGDLPPGYDSNDADYAGCSTLETVCKDCAKACMEAQISDVKANLEPASVFTLGLMGYLVIVVVWNNVMIEQDDIEGVTKMVGLVLNGLLLLLSFVMLIMGGIGAAKAADACPGTSSCVPSSMTMLILLGLATMVVAGITLAGVQTGNSMLIVVATMVMVFLAILMVLFALILGMSTGVVMDDMTYYYDTQYPKLRSALEKADNSYCQMSKADCTAAAMSSTAAPVMAGDPLAQITCEDGDPICITSMPFDSMWKQMHAAASLEANKESAPSWLADCKSTAICIYCTDVLLNVPTVSHGVLDPTAAVNPGAAGTGASCIANNYGTCCTGADGATDALCCSGAAGSCTITAGVPSAGFIQNAPGDSCTIGSSAACVVRAPNFNWRDALYGAKNSTTAWGTSNYVSMVADEDGVGPNLWADSFTGVCAPTSVSCTGTGGTMKVGNGATRCMGEVVTTELDYYVSPDEVAKNPECIAPVSVDSGNINYNKRCANSRAGDSVQNFVSGTDLNAGVSAVLANNDDLDCDTADPTSLGDVYEITPSTVWADIINNFTRFDTPAKEALPYCEEAVNDHVALDANCKEYSQQTDIEKNSFYANCDNCNNPFAPFTFSVPGPEVGYRQCLNFWYGHMGQCSGSSDACKDVFQTHADKAIHVEFMVAKSFGDENSRFCGYSDAGCKAKIKFDLESSMSTIGVIGGIFMAFFLGIIYCTLQAIKSYKGGDDDDDEDE
jgi:hypothetical protein